MPVALERKYPNAGRELGWFWVFPSDTLSTDPRAGAREASRLPIEQVATEREEVTVSMHR